MFLCLLEAEARVLATLLQVTQDEVEVGVSLTVLPLRICSFEPRPQVPEQVRPTLGGLPWCPCPGRDNGPLALSVSTSIQSLRPWVLGGSWV